MPEALENLWDDIRRELREDVTDFTFHIWLEPLELAHRDGDAVFVRAPGHIRTWVKERHHGHLGRAVQRVLGPRATVQLVDESWTPPQAGTPQQRTPTLDESTLNPKYTFGQFVIGDGNRLAHAASLAVAEMPAHAYNPLFIYGPPGLGKTHLLQAIGNYVQLHGNGLRVHYATVEDFTSDFVRSLRRGDTGAFRDRFRGADVLLIDDIQFLADKLKTKGPGYQRDLKIWGYVGQGAIGITCVVLATISLSAAGLPCVIGGAAISAALNYWAAQ